jgi:hypothetical protein
MAARNFGVYVKPIEDLDLINSLLDNSSPSKKHNITVDNRMSFMANAYDIT